MKWPQGMICTKCGGSLFRDESAERVYRLEGRIGTRLYCVAGCTSRYVTTGVIDPLHATLPPRRLFDVTCQERGCGTIFRSSSPVRKYCDPCGVERQRKSAQIKNRKRRGTQRSVAALSTSVRTPQWTARDTHRVALAGLRRR